MTDPIETSRCGGTRPTLARTLLPAVVLWGVMWGARIGPVSAQSGEGILVDDFEAYAVGGLPERWSYLHEKELVPIAPQFMRPKEEFRIAADGANRVLRVITEGEAVHLSMPNGTDALNWDIRELPVLSWDWRAIELPEGAREDVEDLNDSAAAVYVVYSIDGFLFKRPRTIKYVYSSTLPEGTVVSYGKLKVIVVSSGESGEKGWIHVRRDVAADHRMLFGEDPPHRPLTIRLWGDSDNTNVRAVAEYDNIRLLPR